MKEFFDFDELVRARNLIRKHFPDNVVLFGWECDELLFRILVPVDFGVDETIATLDKYDDEAYKLNLSHIPVHTSYTIE